MSLDYKAIGKHIREARRRNHLSQAMLAEAVDKTPSYISYIESGLKSMSLDTFVLIANALGVSPERLLMSRSPTRNGAPVRRSPCSSQIAPSVRLSFCWT